MSDIRVFEHPNMYNFKCPVCNTKADMPIVLVPIPGTEEGNIMRAEQVHKECYDLAVKMQDIENAQIDIENGTKYSV